MKMKWNPITLIKNVSILVMVIIALWFVVSTVQVVYYNLSSEPFEHYSKWNLWLLVNWFND